MTHIFTPTAMHPQLFDLLVGEIFGAHTCWIFAAIFEDATSLDVIANVSMQVPDDGLNKSTFICNAPSGNVLLHFIDKKSLPFSKLSSLLGKGHPVTEDAAALVEVTEGVDCAAVYEVMARYSMEIRVANYTTGVAKTFKTRPPQHPGQKNPELN
ncbi:MAG: hypothetical protein GZ088_15995 [Acidipila sp.]|nr:hypothetical protein [Acidipila sp.]